MPEIIYTSYMTAPAEHELPTENRLLGIETNGTLVAKITKSYRTPLLALLAIVSTTGALLLWGMYPASHAPVTVQSGNVLAATTDVPNNTPGSAITTTSTNSTSTPPHQPSSLAPTKHTTIPKGISTQPPITKPQALPNQIPQPTPPKPTSQANLAQWLEYVHQLVYNRSNTTHI